MSSPSIFYFFKEALTIKESQWNKGEGGCGYFWVMEDAFVLNWVVEISRSALKNEDHTKKKPSTQARKIDWIQ